MLGWGQGGQGHLLEAVLRWDSRDGGSVDMVTVRIQMQASSGCRQAFVKDHLHVRCPSALSCFPCPSCILSESVIHICRCRPAHLLFAIVHHDQQLQVGHSWTPFLRGGKQKKKPTVRQVKSQRLRARMQCTVYKSLQNARFCTKGARGQQSQCSLPCQQSSWPLSPTLYSQARSKS